jgi:hypothetical protein
MKTKPLSLLIVMLLSAPLCYAQFGDLLNKIKNTAEAVEKVTGKPSVATPAQAPAQAPAPAPGQTPAQNPVQTPVEAAASSAERLETVAQDNQPGKGSLSKNTKATNQVFPGKLYFSEKPFANQNDTANAAASFVAGKEIYGMVVMDKNFGEYNDDETKPFMVKFFAKMVSLEGRGNAAYTVQNANIHPRFNKQNYLFFDVSPEPSKALMATEYSALRIGNLFATIKGNETYGDKPKIGLKRTYSVEFSIGSKVFGNNELEIDYTNATKESMRAWAAREEQAFAMSKTNTSKFNDKESADVAKSLPLPQSFLQPSTGGYSDARLSAGNITSMVKRIDGVKEVLQFMFVKTTAQNDFVIYKTSLGVPDYQWGNRFFQFIFKDAAGKCLAGGGRIRMNYEGGGRYGAPYVLWEYPDVQKSEGYLTDSDLKAYVVDCNKVKK